MYKLRRNNRRLVLRRFRCTHMLFHGMKRMCEFIETFVKTAVSSNYKLGTSLRNKSLVSISECLTYLSAEIPITFPLADFNDYEIFFSSFALRFDFIIYNNGYSLFVYYLLHER